MNKMIQLYTIILATLVSYFGNNVSLLDLKEQPYGPKMCLLLCSKIEGCIRTEYDPFHLSCKLMMSNNTGYNNANERIKVDVKSCKERWRLIDSRRRAHLCVKFSVKIHPDGLENDWTVPYSKLLVVPRDGNPGYITQVDLTDHHVSWFPYFDSHIMAVLYFASLKRFIVSTYKAGGVISFKPGLNTTTVLFKHTYVLFMFSDERRKMVFYVTLSGHYLQTFFTNGTGQRLITKLTSHASSGTVNEKVKEIYMTFTAERKIMSLNYDGRILNTLRETVQATFIFYDVKKHSLYFNDNGFQVYTLDTATMNASKVIKSDLVIKSGLVLGEKLYLSSSSVEKEVHVVDLRTNNVTIINLKYKRFQFLTLLMF